MPWTKANRYAKAGYRKVNSGDDRRGHAKGKRKGFDADGGVSCKSCFNMKNENAVLKEEIVRLKAALRHAQKTTKKDVDNAHAPSSARRYKSNASEENQRKQGGAVVGHKGHGRSAIEPEGAESIILLDSIRACPGCGSCLESRGKIRRTVVDVENMHARRVLYESEKQRCKKCHRTYTAKPPVLPKSLYGNRLLAHALTLHYVHGVPIGRVLNIFGEELSAGGLIGAFHRVGRVCEVALPELIEEYRSSLVRHADETGWRTDGRSGYAWIFATPSLSLFEFADTRASRIPKKILGDQKLEGVLVVDRYGGYNKMPVHLQYCYAHLMREVQKLVDEFSDSFEVEQFGSALIPQMALAMKLRTQKISDQEFFEQAASVEHAIKSLMKSDYNHLGIKRMQQIFLTQEHRLYHWAKSRDVPADNNRAEREIRPTVISRKVSFGSQSKQGCKTRQAVMSVLYTAKKRLPTDLHPEEWLKDTLDKIAVDPKLNIYDLLPKTQ